jgi:hypothetical protein
LRASPAVLLLQPGERRAEAEDRRRVRRAGLEGLRPFSRMLVEGPAAAGAALLLRQQFQPVARRDEADAGRPMQRLVGTGDDDIGADAQVEQAGRLARVQQGRATDGAGKVADGSGVERHPGHVAGVREHTQARAFGGQRRGEVGHRQPAVGSRGQHHQPQRAFLRQRGQRPHHRTVFERRGQHDVAVPQQRTQGQVQALGRSRHEGDARRRHTADGAELRAGGIDGTPRHATVVTVAPVGADADRRVPVLHRGQHRRRLREARGGVVEVDHAARWQPTGGRSSDRRAPAPAADPARRTAGRGPRRTR